MPGIYLHIPFCVKKCFYCDFYSEEIFPSVKNNDNALTQIVFNPKIITNFVESLIKEINQRHDDFTSKLTFNTVFFGGGTPSLMNYEQFSRIFDALYKNYTISQDSEITVECNPKTTTKEKLISYRKLGINRLSFGVQSFIPEELEFLQRVHSPGDAHREINNAREAGFDNISLDLMFSLPNQTKESLLYSLEKAVELHPDHISSYSLIYEPETPLFVEYKAGRIKKISDAKDAILYKTTMDFLRNAGYKQYEVSNYTKNGKKCFHNLNYWNGGEYISLGPSAHGYLNNRRYWNYRNNGKYFELISKNQLPEEGSELLTVKEKLIEIIFLGLRAEGINIAEIKSKYQIDLMALPYLFIQSLIADDFISINYNMIRMTDKGYPVCDEIILKILEKLN